MATRTTYRASVTFEYDEAAPQTFRGPVVAVSAEKAASQALRLTRGKFPNARPRSLVIVLEVGERVELPKQAQPAHLAKRGRHGLPGDLHPVDVAILGGDPSL